MKLDLRILFVNDKNGNPHDVILGYVTGKQYLNDSEMIQSYFCGGGKICESNQE